MQKVTETIADELSSIIFGGSEQLSPKELLQCLTSTKSRVKLGDKRAIWKDGISRFPHVNGSTGMTALYMCKEILKIGFRTDVQEKFKTLYHDEIGSDFVGSNPIMAHGPPSLIIKPGGAMTSPPYVYRFQDLTEGTKFTILIPLHEAGDGLQLLTHFETYFDLLAKYFDFNAKSKHGDILYLEKWFDLRQANQFLMEYTILYNYYVRNIPADRSIKISSKTNTFFKKSSGTAMAVPEEFLQMTWEDLKAKDGMFVLTSKQAIRTLNSKSDSMRMFVQIAMEPKPPGWDESSEKSALQMSYETGKFGNWHKPGLRLYIRENSTEYDSRALDGSLKEFINHQWTPSEKIILGIN
ncbi:MAG: hypothetical protein ACMG6E_01805 [Candidatus Roizmanbacteria bacterium]